MQRKHMEGVIQILIVMMFIGQILIYKTLLEIKDSGGEELEQNFKKLAKHLDETGDWSRSLENNQKKS